MSSTCTEDGTWYEEHTSGSFGLVSSTHTKNGTWYEEHTSGATGLVSSTHTKNGTWYEEHTSGSSGLVSSTCTKDGFLKKSDGSKILVKAHQFQAYQFQAHQFQRAQQGVNTYTPVPYPPQAAIAQRSAVMHIAYSFEERSNKEEDQTRT